MKKPELKISILSDYICPFCFFGNLRLDTLREHYDLKINWCFIEIHPETPSTGQSVKLLNYDDAEWDGMMQSLQQLAIAEQVKLNPQTMTTNSRKALLLAEACKPLGADVFYPLHNRIFHAYFVEGQNIGDEGVLRDIARQHTIPENIVNEAWSDPHASGPADSVPDRLLPYLQYAGYLNASSVPTLVIGEKTYNGVLSRKRLLELAQEVTQKS